MRRPGLSVAAKAVYAALATYAAAGGIREVEDSAMVVWPLIPGHQPP